tara:strand:+ start:868 stop:1293 length:426 start_codon:yes stop_codon:yes gene_type:complete
MPATLTQTYDIVTEESAANSETAEHGFYMPGGWTYPIPDGLTGEAFDTWCEETGPFAEPYDEDDYTGDRSDHLIERGIAQALLHDGFGWDHGDGIEWRGEDWMDETEDGEAGCMTRRAHVAGCDAGKVLALAKAGSADANL